MVSVYIDSSTNNVDKAIGAYSLSTDPNCVHFFELNSFKSTSAEFETLERMLKEVLLIHKIYEIYTDCQSIHNMINNKYSKTRSKYPDLVNIIELNNIIINKIKGHQSHKLDNNIHRNNFKIVDRKCRKKLRETIKNVST